MHAVFPRFPFALLSLGRNGLSTNIKVNTNVKSQLEISPLIKYLLCNPNSNAQVQL